MKLKFKFFQTFWKCYKLAEKDCSETFIDPPRKKKEKEKKEKNCITKCYWSHYKYHNTIEFLVCVYPNSIISLSKSTLGGPLPRQLSHSFVFQMYDLGIII